MEPTHAKIKFHEKSKSDEEPFVVEITEILQFGKNQPSDVNDFTKDNLYDIMYKDTEDDEEYPVPVQIASLAVCTSKEEVTKFEMKRGNFCPLNLSTVQGYEPYTNSSIEEEEEEEEEEVAVESANKKKKKVDKEKQKKVAIKEKEMQDKILKEKQMHDKILKERIEKLKNSDNLSFQVTSKTAGYLPSQATLQTVPNENVMSSEESTLIEEKYNNLQKQYQKIVSEHKAEMISLKNRFNNVSVKYEDLSNSYKKCKEQLHLVMELNLELQKKALLGNQRCANETTVQIQKYPLNEDTNENKGHTECDSGNVCKTPEFSEQNNNVPIIQYSTPKSTKAQIPSKKIFEVNGRREEISPFTDMHDEQMNVLEESELKNAITHSPQEKDQSSSNLHPGGDETDSSPSVINNKRKRFHQMKKKIQERNSQPVEEKTRHLRQSKSFSQDNEISDESDFYQESEYDSSPSIINKRKRITQRVKNIFEKKNSQPGPSNHLKIRSKKGLTIHRRNDILLRKAGVKAKLDCNLKNTVKSKSSQAAVTNPSLEGIGKKVRDNSVTRTDTDSVQIPMQKENDNENDHAEKNKKSRDPNFSNAFEKYTSDEAVRMIYLNNHVSITTEEWREWRSRDFQKFINAVLRKLYNDDPGLLSKKCQREGQFVRTPEGINKRSALTPVKKKTIYRCAQLYCEKEMGLKDESEIRDTLVLVSGFITDYINTIIKEIKKEKEKK